MYVPLLIMEGSGQPSAGPFRQKRSSVADEYLLLHQGRSLDEESVASSAEGREIQIKESNEFLARNNLYY